VHNAPPASVEDASISVWIHPTDGTDFIYYDKGAVLGLLLDIAIRDASDNRQSLDDVMRRLYQATYPHGHGFTNDEFWAVVSRAAGGRSFAEFHHRYVDGSDAPPYDSILPLAGMRFTSRTWRAPRLGISTFGDTTGVARITAVVPGGVFGEAGGLPGDTLVMLGGVEVRRDPDFDAFRDRWADHEGATFPIVVRRGGQEVTLSGRVRLVERTDLRLDYDANPPRKAARVRSGVLHGKTDR
jgi:predicted metalloprotease with PDZ domain